MYPHRTIAYFITYTTYGTWLHGDERGCIIIDKKGRHRLGPNRPLEQYQHNHLAHSEVRLDAARRALVLAAITGVCDHKQWFLYTAHVRSNHVHFIVASAHLADTIMTATKSWATRRLRENGHDLPRVWTRHGSTQKIFTNEDLFEKLHYVIFEQGETMSLYIADRIKKHYGIP